jgi:hypothetical protein
VTSWAIKKTVSAPRVVGSCLVRAHDRKSGSPERVTIREPCPVMPRDDDSDLRTHSDCPTSGKERTAVTPDSPNRLSRNRQAPRQMRR